MPLPPPVIKIVLLVSFIIRYPDKRRPTCEHFGHYLMDSRIVEIAAWSRPVHGFPADFGERRAGREPLDQVGIGDVGSSSATFPCSFFIVKCRSSLVAR